MGHAVFDHASEECADPRLVKLFRDVEVQALVAVGPVDRDHDDARGEGLVAFGGVRAASLGPGGLRGRSQGAWWRGRLFEYATRRLGVV